MAIRLRVCNPWQCHRGYNGTGFECEDVDECFPPANQPPPCGANADCTDSPGSFQCQVLPASSSSSLLLSGARLHLGQTESSIGAVGAVQ